MRGLAAATLAAAFATEIFVAPDGNDNWSEKLLRPNAARTDGPPAFSTGARDAIRRLKPGQALGKNVTVWFFDRPLLI